MSPPLVSEAERRYLLDGVAQGLRNDGRGCFDYRRICYEAGPIAAATGSCRLQAGETDLLVGIKCDIVRPGSHTPGLGHFSVAVECSASISPFLSEGGAATEDAGRQLALLLETLCANDDVLDRAALCVAPGVFAWEVFAEILVLRSGGNLLDSLSLALCIALSDTLLPKVEVTEAMEEGESAQFVVDDRPEVGTPLPMRRLPLCVTVAQIQNRVLLDVTPEEELCSEAMLCVVIDAKCGEVIGMHKLGCGLFDSSAVPAMLQGCRATAAALVQQLEDEGALRTAPL